MRDEQGTVLAYEGTLPNKGQDILPAPEPAKSYTVTFCYNDGRENTTKTTGINGKLGDLPAPYREGYVFDGWYTTGGEKVDLTRVYSSNTVLYARWSEYIAPSPNVKKAPVILLAASPDTVTEGEQVMLSVSETSGFGVDLSGSNLHGRSFAADIRHRGGSDDPARSSWYLYIYCSLFR